MSYRIAAAVAALAVLSSLPLAASAATVDQILGSPSAFDGHHVEVKGTVENLQQNVSHQGNPYATYSICSSQCIKVFAFGSPAARNGQTITVHGTYEVVNHINGYTLHNGIEADGGTADSETPCS